MKKSNKFTILIVGLFILVYYFLTTVYKILDPILFPQLSQLYAAFIESLPNLKVGIASSLKLLIPSMGLSIILGVSIGLIVGWHKSLKEILMPIIYALSPIPAPLYTPYAIMLFPTFWHSSVFIIFIGSFG